MKFFRPIQQPSEYIKNFHLSQNTWEGRFASISVIVQSVITGVLLIVNWKNLPPKIPLWYSRPWGEERLAHPLFLILIPLTAIMVYGVNRTLTATIASEHPLFGRVLSLVSLLVSLYSCIIIFRIVTLVT